jgi:predicted nucleotidyltransferase
MTTRPDPSSSASAEERAAPPRSPALDEDATLRRIVDTIVEALDPEQVILFGSRARGDDTAQSDYDLCVIRKQADGRRDLVRQIHGLFGRRDFSMDVFVLTPDELDEQASVANTLGYIVARDGEVLYECSSSPRTAPAAGGGPTSGEWAGATDQNSLSPHSVPR